MPITQIMPPELTQASGGSTQKKPFNTQEFLANKLAAGESAELRMLGTYDDGLITYYYRCALEERQPDGSLKFAGYGYNDQPDFPDAARQTDWTSADKRKLEEKVKPQRCLCFLAWNYATDQLEVALFDKKSLREALVEILSDEDYSFDSEGIANFTMKVSRQGEGIDTAYSLLPKAGKQVEAKVAKAFAEVKETAKMSHLLAGRHPLRKPAAEFLSASASSEF